MAPALIVLVAFLLYFLGYRFYSGYLSNRVFQLRSDSGITPAHTLKDGIDYVPTQPSVLFGHHYASIAGLAPVLGPAVAVIWGWLPALAWVVLGGIFVGCVHDFGSLVVSIRNRGKSIGQVAEEIIGNRARSLFHAIIFFLVSLAMGVFVLVIAGLYSAPKEPSLKPKTVIEEVTSHDLKKEHDSGILKKMEERPPMKSNFPESVLPTLALMLSAVVVGYLHHRKGFPLGVLTSISLVVVMMVVYLSMQEDVLNWTGLAHPDSSPSTDSWKWILLGYAFLASVTPVWLLLQSRDFINSFLLYLGIILIYTGFFLGSSQGELPSFHTPAIRGEEIGLELLPFVFITIACGAASGFHSLVSSGTTAKQIDREVDARWIGYGGMIGESLLGLTAVIACTVGFSSDGEWNLYYRSWSGLQGLSVQVGAYIQGTGRFLGYLGIPAGLGQGFIALIVISFALTSLDSATRLLRYNIEEIADSTGSEHIKKWVGNRYISSLIACAAIGFFAFLKVEVNGQIRPAGLALWKLFGTTNQLLAGLSLLIVSLYLFQKKRNFWVSLIPMSFVLIVTLWAMIENLMEFFYSPNPNYLLGFVGSTLLVLALWVLVEGYLIVRRSLKEI